MMEGSCVYCSAFRRPCFDPFFDVIRAVKAVAMTSAQPAASSTTLAWCKLMEDSCLSVTVFEGPV